MNKAISIFLSVALLFLFFSITLQEFLFSDDIQNFFLRNSLVIYNPHISVLQVASNENIHWMAQGRFTPLAFLWQESIFMSMPSVMTYRWFVLFMNFLGIGAFLFLLHTIGLKINRGLWVLCLCAVMQFRIQYHDAYTSLNGMYQFLAVLIFASLSGYVLFVKTGKWYYLLTSLFLYAAAHLQSEVGLAGIFFMPATGLLLRVPFKKLLKQASPYFLITGVYLATVTWLKMNIPDKDAVYIGLQPNFAIADMWDLFKRQMFATLPFSNFYEQRAIPETLYHRFTLVPLAFFCVIMFTVGILFFSKTENQNQSLNRRYILFFLLLAIVPALFILPSSKYQHELQMGSGYLPVYIQNFGTATLLAYIINYLLARKSFLHHLTGRVLNIAIAVAIAVTFLFNSALINARMYELSSPVIAQYKSLKDGVLKDVPEGSTIVIPYFWKMAWIYDEVFQNLYSRKFVVVNADEYHPSSNSRNQNCYVLETLPGTPIYTRLYSLNCGGWQRGNLLIEKIQANTLQETENEKWILHRIFKW